MKNLTIKMKMFILFLMMGGGFVALNILIYYAEKSAENYGKA